MARLIWTEPAIADLEAIADALIRRGPDWAAAGRSIPGNRADRPRRHVHGLLRAGRTARTAGGGQGAGARHGRRTLT